MTENNLQWTQKLFTKLFGFDDLEDFQDTLDQTNKSDFIKKKGIKITKNQHYIQSMVLPQTYDQQIDKKWLNLIRMSYNSVTREQLLALTYQGISYPHKVVPWLAQNKYKINPKLYNIKKNQYRTCINPNNHFKLQKMNSQLMLLVNKFGQSKISQLLGVFMIYRQDIQYSDTLLKIGQTVDDYLYDAPVMAFSLLNYFCCTGSYLPFLTNDIQAINSILNQICFKINFNCSSASFFIRDKILLHQYVRDMIEVFWLNISQPKTLFRQKILYYLLINKMSLKAMSKVCQAAITGLSRILNQGNKQKSLQVLRNPQIFLDKQIFLQYLFSQN